MSLQILSVYISGRLPFLNIHDVCCFSLFCSECGVFCEKALKLTCFSPSSWHKPNHYYNWLQLNKSVNSPARPRPNWLCWNIQNNSSHDQILRQKCDVGALYWLMLQWQTGEADGQVNRGLGMKEVRWLREEVGLHWGPLRCAIWT